MNASIAIVGGGLGGLTCGIALARRRLTCTIYERAPEVSEVGAGIWLPPNALQVLDRLGMADDLMLAGVPVRRIELCAVGRRAPLRTVELDWVVEKFGFPTVSVRRSSLQRLLVEEIGPEALQRGSNCVSVRQGPGSAVVDFEDGSHVEADIVIGADGLRSVVREAVEPDVPLRDSGQLCFRGLADYVLPDELAGVCRETWGGRARFGFCQVGRGAVYWFAPIAAARDESVSSAEFTGLYSDFPSPVPELLANTEAESISCLRLFDIAPRRQWHKGRVVLLGDAAHPATPNLGQGGAQAMEDALALAAAVASAHDHSRAFDAYQRMRLDKARHIVRRSLRLGQVAHYRGWLARTLRDSLMRALPTAYARRQLARLYSIDELRLV